MATTLKIFVISLAVLLIAFIAMAIFPARKEVVQPIAYNHNLHVEGEGLECTDCHIYVEELASATLPKLDTCLDCHDIDPLSESPEEEKLIQYIEAEQEIPWIQVYHVPKYVYFSHRRHVALGELECSSCHGEMAKRTTPVTSPVQDISMEFCMNCHDDHNVTNDCLACHR